MNFVHRHYLTLGSTNDEARRLMVEGAPEGTVVRADVQTAGRGRQGRRWISDPGNLFCSIILSPACSLSYASQLSFVMALAVGKTIEPFLESASILGYKWPNDIMLKDSKIGGILIETESHDGGKTNDCIAGIGLNLVTAPDRVAYPAAALSDFTNRPVILQSIFLEIIYQIKIYYNQWQDEGFDTIRHQWLMKAYGLGQVVTVRAGDGKISGEFVGLNPEGYLILKGEDGIVRELASAEIMAG